MIDFAFNGKLVKFAVASHFRSGDGWQRFWLLYCKNRVKHLCGMTRKTKKFSFWFRRRSHLPLLVVGTLVVVLLFLNDNTSISLNMQYERQIVGLNRQIKENLDSAEYYRNRRQALVSNPRNLESVAREQYFMQRPTEDVYVIVGD